jgi:hypothetical protein
MSQIINALQKFSPKDWSGLTTTNHIGAMYGENPIMVSEFISKIYDVNLGLDLDRFMDQFPTMELERDAPFEWMLTNNSPFKNIPLIQYYTDVALSAQGSTPGVGQSRFWVEFNDRIFEQSDVIAPASYAKETYQFRVMSDPRPNGSNWIFEVALVTGDDTLFAPQDILTNGVRWVKMYALHEQTLSQRGSSSLSFTSPFRMQNRCAFMRKDYMVPGNMIDQKENAPLGFYFIDNNGNRQTTWLGTLDYNFMVDFRRMKSMLQLYGKSLKNSQGAYNMKGESGYEIRTGFGLMDQIAPSNVHYYSTFSLEVLEEILMSLSVGKLPEDSRKFVLGTGEYGMRQVHKAIETLSVAYSPNRTEKRISGEMKSLTYGGQFRKYVILNGIEIELMHIPFLDDPSLCSDEHPDGGILSSYEYLILDFGTSNGSPNIQKVNVKNSEVFKYIPGMRDPFSPNNPGTKPGMTVSKVDGYEVMKSWAGGIKVHNPMRIARFIPNLS